MKKEENPEKEKMPEKNQEENKTETTKITKKDLILMLIITFIYAIISFINLGTFINPQTFWKTENVGDFATFKIEQGTVDVSNIRYYSGVDFGEYDLYVSYDGENYAEPLCLNEDKVFAWQDFGLTGDFQYIKLVGKKEGIYLGEIAIYDTNGNKLQLTPLDENAKLILDEQDTVPEEISYLNSTYFDEIYFARTAYEHQHNLPIYEWTHPPLGKLIMIIPMLLRKPALFSYLVYSECHSESLKNAADPRMLLCMLQNQSFLFHQSSEEAVE